MPRVDKGEYADRQDRQVERVEAGYVEHGLPEDEAERLAWAAVNDEHHGREKAGGRKNRVR